MKVWLILAGTIILVMLTIVFANFMVAHDQANMQKFCDKLHAQADGVRSVCIRDGEVVYQR